MVIYHQNSRKESRASKERANVPSNQGYFCRGSQLQNVKNRDTRMIKDEECLRVYEAVNIPVFTMTAIN